MTAPLTPGRAVLLVARREFTTQIRSKSFAIGLVVTIVIFAIYIALFSFIGSQSSSNTLGVTSSTVSLEPALQAAARAEDRTLTITQVDRAAGEAQVADGDLDALFDGGPGTYSLLGKDTVDSDLQRLVSTAVQQTTLTQALTAAGQDPAAVAARGAVAIDTQVPVDPERGQRLVLAIVVAVLLFMSLIGYGNAVAQGVVEEKSSRVVELLLSTIRPVHLLSGKVLGLGLVGLVQLLILSGIGLVGALGVGILTIPTAAAGALVSAVVWYLLGFFLYASIYAAAGSLVSRQEELQSTVAPIMFPLFIPFIFAVSVLPNDPRNTLGAILSFIPLFSPTLMPARAAMGVAPMWQVLVAIALTVLAIVGVVLLAARIYKNSVLRTGSRVGLREALRTRA
ncbi:ABC transporter permease [Pseudonocardia benzenivorans]|uniref:ABC-type Na+ efflux pump permease component n=2 Tax=Pseudonocardia TaxID=1847 RepID=F4CTS2_PSEUX|nr:ABC transporter permease [Pseudonocardia dioxanivorans]AEA22881.1 ABC-type Na+ efflux pump permease component [Pseudonocardia dioxanivorans CB1190]GJF06755.1 ABC transporter permease [Pseudonocardia sp. D17]